MKNRDRLLQTIAGMSDERLAKFINENIMSIEARRLDDDYCDERRLNDHCPHDYKCEDCITKWLNEEEKQQC